MFGGIQPRCIQDGALGIAPGTRTCINTFRFSADCSSLGRISRGLPSCITFGCAVFDWVKNLPVQADVVQAKPPRSLTPEWFQARRGRITASKRALIIHGTEPGWQHLGDELLAEMSQDWEHKDIDNVAMRWGRDHEREALDAIQDELGELTEPGLLLKPGHPYAGATPDGFIGGDITVQAKCPFMPRNHLCYFVDRKLSPDYYCQVQFEAWVSGRTMILFASYDPRQAKRRRLFMMNIPVDLAYFESFDTNLARFKQCFETDRWPPSVRRVDSGAVKALFS